MELAIKDALKATVFDFIDELLLGLYYLMRNHQRSAGSSKASSPIRKSVSTLTMLGSSQSVLVTLGGLHTSLTL